MAKINPMNSVAMSLSPQHHSSLVMLALLIGFAVIHSGGASLRAWGGGAHW